MLALLLSGLCSAQEFKTAWVRLNDRPIVVDVADTPASQERGLAGRSFLPSGRGMLFIFELEESQHFWMKDTPIDLDLAFFNSQFVLVDLTTLKAMDERIYSSREAAQYVLELPAGWLELNSIELGHRLEITEAQ